VESWPKKINQSVQGVGSEFAYLPEMFFYLIAQIYFYTRESVGVEKSVEIYHLKKVYSCLHPL